MEKMHKKTLPQLLLDRAVNNGNQIAMRQKNLGIWNEITWSSYFENVMNLALGLLTSLEFKEKDKLAIIGGNRPQWLFAELAAQSLGGIAVGVYRESSSSELLYMLNQCDAKIVIVEDQELVDKLLEIEDELCNIEKIIYYNHKGMREYNHPKLIYLMDLQEIGKKFAERNPGEFEKLIASGNADDTAIIAYSAGTTGESRGIILSHQNLIYTANQMVEIDPVKENDDYFSYLPLTWIGEQVMSITTSICQGVVLNFPEEISTVRGDLREIGPHILFAPPRMYENLISGLKLRMQESSWLKKKVYNLFSPYALKISKAKLNNAPVSFKDKLMYTLGDFLIFSAIRDHLGLARVKRAYTGAGSIGSEVVEFFHGIGVNLKQTYGSTELSGIAFMHRDGDIKLDSVGKALPNTEVKISDEGEILIKGPGVFQGYYNNEVMTQKVLVDDWLHMGDAGHIGDDGHLYVVDRMENIILTKAGDKISPSYVENKLRLSPYIREAVVLEKGRPYIVAMINIDSNNVGRWAGKNQLVYTSYSELASLPEVIELIEKEISSIMINIPEYSRVKKFVLLYKELTKTQQELTRLRRVRRNYIIEKYQDIIDGMYGTENETCIQISDGSGKKNKVQIVLLDIGQEVA